MDDHEFFGLTRRRFTDDELRRIGEYVANKLAKHLREPKTDEH